MKATRLAGTAVLCGLLASQTMGQEQAAGNPYPLLTRFLGKHQAFSATLVTAVQSADGMLMEGGQEKYVYLDGKVRMEAAFSDQWMALFALSPPDTDAIKRAGLDTIVEICLPDQKKHYAVFPSAKAYCDLPLPDGVHPPSAGDLKIERAADGSEVVDGHRCLRTKVTIRETKLAQGAAEEKVEATLWEAQDLNGFPIKIRARMETPMGVFVSTEAFANVKLGEPERSLFAMPAGFKAYRSMEELSGAVQKTMAAGEQRSEAFWKAVKKGDVAETESLSKQSPELIRARRTDGQTPLHVAARAGRKETVQWLIGNKGDVNAPDNRKSTALHEAAVGGQRNVIELLLKAGAKIDAEDIDARTPLLVAAANGQKDAVGALLAAGANPNKRDSQQMTALHVAAARGARDVVALLLSHKAEPNAKNKRGLTPLWEAMIQGYDDAVELLATHGGDINAVGLDGQTPLCWAVTNNRKTMVKTLVATKAGGDVSVVGVIDNGNFVPVHLSRDASADQKNAYRQPLLLVAVAKGDPESVRLILGGGGDVNVKGPRGETALHWAASHGSVEMTKLLIDCKADVDAANGDKDTPLHVAFRAGHKEIVKLLIEAHADLEVRGQHGLPALHMAAENGWEDIVELLLGKGAVACAEADDVSAYMSLASWYARNLGHNDVAEFLKPYEDACSSKVAALRRSLGAGSLAAFQEQLRAAPELLRYRDRAGSTLLREAARSGRLEFVQYLLDCGGDPGWHKRSGDLLLLSAAAGGNADIVRLFLDRGANVNAKGELGRTPLFVASTKEIAETLVAHGADIEAHDVYNRTPLFIGGAGVAEVVLAHKAQLTAMDVTGVTPLHWAAMCGQSDKVELMLAHGADVEIKDKHGQTALHSAAYYGHKTVVEVLLAHHADVNSKDADGNTAVNKASQTGHTEIVKLLTDKGGTLTPERVDAVLQAAGDQLRDAVVNGELETVKAVLNSHPEAINSTNGVGYSALMLAASNGQVAIAEFLLAHGADVNAKDRLVGRTPLHWAITSYRAGAVKIVEMLLARHPDVNAKDNTDSTPLYEAARVGSAEMTGMLLTHGANITTTNKLGKTTQQIASGGAVDMLKQRSEEGIKTALAAKALRDAVSAGNTEITRRLLAENPLIVNATDETGRPPLRFTTSPVMIELLLKNKADPNPALMDAVSRADSNVTAMLLSYGADVNPKGGGWKPLHEAVLGRLEGRPGYENIVALLVAHGADVNATIEWRQTPLHMAAWWGRTKAAEILLANKADVTALDAHGQTALHIAAMRGNGQITKLLLAAKADVGTKTRDGQSPLHLASASGSVEPVEALLAAGADLNVTNRDGAGPLHLAASAAVAKAFLDRGAKVGATDNKQRTPLHCAASAGRTDVVALLLSARADVNARDAMGWTALHDAAAQNRKDVADVLLISKADPNARAKDGKTPLHLATSQELAEFLLAHGADIHAVTTDGSTPADEARHANRVDLATYLHQRAEAGEKALRN